MTRKEAADRLFQIKNEKKLLEHRLKEVEALLIDVESQLIMLMENESLSSFKDKDIGTVFIREDIRASIESKEEFLNWLKQNNLEDSLSVNNRTLCGLFNDYESIPGVKTYYQPKISIRKGKRKGK